MKIGFYGCGHLGEAFLKSLKVPGVSDEFIILGRTQKRLDFLEKTYQVKTTLIPQEISDCDVIFFAIKPQDLERIQPLKTSAVVASFLAGVSLKTLQPFFSKSRIIRTLPNIGQSVGHGITLVYSEKNEEKSVLELIQRGSQIVSVEKESDINTIGSLTGCGPGILFFILMQFKQLAENRGISPELAEQIAQKLIFGSSSLLESSSEKKIKNMLEKVATKGGITERVVSTLETGNLYEILSKSMNVGSDAMESWEREFEQENS